MHKDERGVIEDLLVAPLSAVTRISTVKGAIRGNHYHERTRQWTYVLSGLLRIKTDKDDAVWAPGDLVEHEPGEPHAWQAFSDVDCLVFTAGPRGEDYESDTFRLQEPLID